MKNKYDLSILTLFAFLILCLYSSNLNCQVNDNGNHFSGHFSGDDNVGQRNIYYGRYNAYGDNDNDLSGGADNSLFGSRAGYYLEQGSQNSCFGADAGLSLKTSVAIENSFFGYRSGTSSNNQYNSFFGSRSGEFNVGNYNSFFGHRAGIGALGNLNSAFGHLAGARNTSGENNCAFGNQSGLGTPLTANYNNNSFYGALSGFSINTGSDLCFFGFESGYSNTTASKNSFFGNQSGYSNTTGENNVFIGYLAGASSSTGNNNTYIGNQSGLLNVGNFNTAIGSLSGIYNGDYSVYLGYNAGPTSVFEDTSHRLYIDNSQNNAPLIYGEFDNNFVKINGNFEVQDRIKFDVFNSFYGVRAGNYNTTGAQNSFFGFESGYTNTTGDGNTFSGFYSGRSITTGNDNSFYGARSGYEITDAYGNSFFGYASGRDTNIGSNNSFFGFSAGRGNTTGNNNVFSGRFSGFSNGSGENNVYLGASTASGNVGGNDNTIVGHFAGQTLQSGNNNTFVGRYAGINFTGSDNIVLGSNTGPTGYNELPSDSILFIDVQQSNTPLIYGEFDNDFVKINGTFEVTAGLSNPSDVNLKNNFEEVNATDILNKISNLPISKWTYKDRQSETHIGATAQDFHAAFGLGTDDKHISTIDADGVALAAIQALKKENDEQAALIQKLIHRIEKLENK